MLKPAVEGALNELRAQFGDKVQFEELPDGGCRVIVDGVELGSQYRPSVSWVGFTITALYPYADIYPHFVTPELQRVDGQPFCPAFHRDNNFYGRPAVMISRRTRAFDAENPNNAVLKLLKVQSWMQSL